MDSSVANALAVLAERGERLRSVWHLDWPVWAEQATGRLRLTQATRPAGPGLSLPSLVAVVGGASSGKSTVFNNLLEGHLASKITAQGHMTKGPILAIHEDLRDAVESLLETGRLLPGLRRAEVELDDDVAGEPDAIVMLFHTIDSLRDVLLFDTPDFTSQAARNEGDIAWTLLPWFDRLAVIVDHERWFDRQTISKLRAESSRFGQARYVLFNRTREGALADADAAALRRQADRLGAEGLTVLEFRRGRGLCRFPPGSLDPVHAFLKGAAPDRTAHLLRQVSIATNQLANQNEERAVRLANLRESVKAAVDRAVPSTADCMTALMTAEEREQLDIVSRVLRMREGRAWLSRRARRIRGLLRDVPVIGAIVGTPPSETWDGQRDGADRQAIGRSYFQACARRWTHELRRVAVSSAFWDELRRWTGLEPSGREFSWTHSLEKRVADSVDRFDRALAAWNEKVETECRGFKPHVVGGVGLGVLALAVVLVAVPGPVAALTLVSAKGAIGAALAKLGTAAGAGALFGKQMGRFFTVIREKLLGSPEFDAVRAAADEFRRELESAASAQAQEVIREAAALVMPPDDDVALAIEVLRGLPEVSP